MLHSAALTKRAAQSRSKTDVDAALGTLAMHYPLADQLAALIVGKGNSNNIEYVLDPERVRRFAMDTRTVLQEIEPNQ